jgi:hypothetical protein
MKNEGHFGCSLLDFKNWDSEIAAKAGKAWLIWLLVSLACLCVCLSV